LIWGGKEDRRKGGNGTEWRKTGGDEGGGNRVDGEGMAGRVKTKNKGGEGKLGKKREGERILFP